MLSARSKKVINVNEKWDIKSLVGHNYSVEVGSSLVDIDNIFKSHNYDYMAVVDKNNIVGICSRNQINKLYRDESILPDNTIEFCMVENYCTINEDTPLDEIISKVFSRDNIYYYDDFVVTQSNGDFIGLIQVANLMRLHMVIIKENSVGLKRLQQDILDKKSELNLMGQQLKIINLELEQARSEASEGSRLKSEFLANVSHEVRTPMNGIVGMVSLLQESNLDYDQKQFTDIIQSSADSLLSTVDEILDLSKLEEGNLTIEKIPFNLTTIVEESVNSLSEKAYSKGIDLDCFIDPLIPLDLIGDGSRYRQVIVDLVSNAVKFTAHGGVVVRVKLEKKEDGNLFILTDVSDSGIGISKEAMDKIFSPFMQVDGSHTRKYEGTGLGLAISNKLIELMGGKLECESEFGKTARFWFTIPLQLPENEVIHTDIEKVLYGLRVLIVSENENISDFIERYLITQGVNSFSVSSESEAVEEIRSKFEKNMPYDIALVDYKMAKMNGLEMSRMMQLIPESENIKYILMSTIVDEISTDQLCRENIYYNINKPIRKSELFGSLTAIIQNEIQDVNKKTIIPNKGKRVSTSHDQNALNVLVVDDILSNQEVARGMLIKFGCNVVVAKNGCDAIEEIRYQKYDCILMDCQMPEMDGLEATDYIRNCSDDSIDSEIYIIAMTAYTMQGDRERCFNAGMNDYISKPINVNHIKDALSKCKEYNSLRSDDSSNLRSNNKIRSSSMDETQILFEETINLIDELKIEIDESRFENAKNLANDIYINSSKFHIKNLQDLAYQIEQNAIDEYFDNCEALMELFITSLEVSRKAHSEKLSLNS